MGCAVDPRTDQGRLAELHALRLLKSRGWRCLAERWSCRYGELDLIMIKPGCSGPRLLLVEVKAEGPEYRATAEAVGAVLQDRFPRAAVMSFHPGVVTWFAEAWPERIRGQVAMDRSRYPEGFSGNRLDALMEMLRMRVGRPHFLAYDIRDLPSDLSTGYRHVGLPVLTWTVRSDAERARAAESADTIIFEETA